MYSTQSQKVSVSKNITTYMNARYERHYTVKEIKIISISFAKERVDRKNNSLYIASRTIKGRQQIYNRVADIANKKIGRKVIRPIDVERFKICQRQESENRTGKCTWSIPEARKKLGFDPLTGLEINKED
jgi:hypothetical protein